MAGINLLVFLKEGPNLGLAYFQKLLKPLQDDEITNHHGKFILIEDFGYILKGSYFYQKRDLPRIKNICDAFYTLEAQWIEWDFGDEPQSAWDQKFFEYFNSVPDDVWLYMIHCRV